VEHWISCVGWSIGTRVDALIDFRVACRVPANGGVFDGTFDDGAAASTDENEPPAQNDALFVDG
jgi:hypothetical protein